ncbi:hypothetical protein SSX86_025256 [Deinandra increscens subsp. villosa]|uniref:Membrane protein of ER body-like protein n=1 Tax=Deinandra increscens subsp. villosa TaxID=3103831 RepID=A0AAP0GL90_9ASTR
MWTHDNYLVSITTIKAIVVSSGQYIHQKLDPQTNILLVPSGGGQPAGKLSDMADVAEQVRTEVEEWTTELAEKAVTTGAFLLNEIANRNGLGQNGAGSKVSDNSESDGATSEESGSEEEGGGPSQVETGLKAAFTTANDQKVSDILEFDGTTSGNEIGARTGESSKDVGEVVEEEIVELEFDKVKPKLATHSMHCPHCKSEITKVTLRRKVLLYRPPTVVEDSPVVPPEPQPETDPEEPLVGCLSCLSVFTFSGNGRFKAFDIFPKNSQSPPSAGETESCLSMFWVTPNPNPIAAEAVDPPQAPLLETVNVSRSPVDTDVEAGSGVVGSRGRSWLGYEGVLAEILKSIVYGGLLEVIASLSVVASAAASDASTLSIISVALATLVGGIFVIGHNLWDLKDDCHKATSNNEEAASKYKELLGQVNYFPLHAFFAMLSFLVFGMVPPAAYGFAFHKTNDKDFTIVAAATASLICVVLLAIFKSFINKCTAFAYFKTVVYYITTAVSVSGVSYVAGNLLTRFMEDYGLFDMSLGGGMSLLSHTTTPSLSSF